MFSMIFLPFAPTRILFFLESVSGHLITQLSESHTSKKTKPEVCSTYLVSFVSEDHMYNCNEVDVSKSGHY